MVARRRDNAIKEDAMSHDKIKAATRERMARTGEPYALARRAVIRDHEEAQRQNRVGPNSKPCA